MYSWRHGCLQLWPILIYTFLFSIVHIISVFVKSRFYAKYLISHDLYKGGFICVSHGKWGSFYFIFFILCFSLSIYIQFWLFCTVQHGCNHSVSLYNRVFVEVLKHVIFAKYETFLDCKDICKNNSKNRHFWGARTFHVTVKLVNFNSWSMLDIWYILSILSAYNSKYIAIGWFH